MGLRNSSELGRHQDDKETEIRNTQQSLFLEREIVYEPRIRPRSRRLYGTSHFNPNTQSDNNEDRSVENGFDPIDDFIISRALYMRYPGYRPHSVPTSWICPGCNRKINNFTLLSEHLSRCFDSKVLRYNDEQLTVDKGECPICFEDMNVGMLVARLPCLCVYHKECLNSWFEIKRTCPVHPDSVETDYHDV
ncbi:hypothetical protein GJ496_002049 [Pomphorhynchus laevis]|nr:hypothetical protein GJ496_002049 [Pomphorhynchus laevis]